MENIIYFLFAVTSSTKYFSCWNNEIKQQLERKKVGEDKVPWCFRASDVRSTKCWSYAGLYLKEMGCEAERVYRVDAGCTSSSGGLGSCLNILTF